MRRMRGWLAVAGISVTLASQGLAQTPAPAAPVSMPGTTVGSSMAKPILTPVGSRLPSAAPQVGTPISGLASSKPGAIGPGANGATQPQGKPIDMKNVVAPYPNMPKESTFWEKLEERWFAMFESDTPAVRPNYTPGIGRRNRERAAERRRAGFWD
ncbi:MAG: hypothetical protein ACRC8S_12820 [Fimbriiglobus sp.]